MLPRKVQQEYCELALTHYCDAIFRGELSALSLHRAGFQGFQDALPGHSGQSLRQRRMGVAVRIVAPDAAPDEYSGPLLGGTKGDCNQSETGYA